MPGSLKGRTIVVTRPKDQARGFIASLKAHGARILACPTIKVVPPKSYAALDKAVRELEAYDWLIFSSANAVQHFMKRFRAKRGNRQVVKKIKTCAIGPATAQEMRKSKIPVTRISKDFVAESILEALPDVEGKSVLIPSAKDARKVLPEGLKARGAKVTVAVAYQTVPEKRGQKAFKRELDKGKINCVTFTSSSTVKNFFSLLTVGEKRRIIKDKQIAAASIGPVTSDTLKHYGWAPLIIAKKPTTENLARAILNHYGKGKS